MLPDHNRPAAERTPAPIAVATTEQSEHRAKQQSRQPDTASASSSALENRAVSIDTPVSVRWEAATVPVDEEQIRDQGTLAVMALLVLLGAISLIVLARLAALLLGSWAGTRTGSRRKQ
jgi:hypothetical protein